MRRVIVVCEMHEDETAAVVGFRFFWPESSSWYECDLCKGCSDSLPVRQIIEKVKPLTCRQSNANIQKRPLSAGIKWFLAVNTGVKSGIGLEHATAVSDGIRSLCGQIKDIKQHAGPASGTAPMCKTCVSSVETKLEKRRQKTAGENPTGGEVDSG